MKPADATEPHHKMKKQNRSEWSEVKSKNCSQAVKLHEAMEETDGKKMRS